MSRHVKSQVQPVYSTPTAPPREWTLASLRQHLQTAVILELYTIPLYLFASYSIKSDSGEKEQKAADDLKKIVVQEMIHLGLAGNLLCALRGHPQVYGEAFTPKYPSEILYEGVLMTLAPATKNQIANFAEVEQPADHIVDMSHDQAETRTLGQYESIGQFYESLRQGLNAVHERLKNPDGSDDMFDVESAKRQWKGHGPEGSNLDIITDLTTALNKLQLIIDQGEGGLSESRDESHFGVFTRLSQLDLDTYPVASNPRTSQFKGREDCYPVMLAFDASYSYLLWTLEAGWTYGGPKKETRDKITGNLHSLMIDILAPLARFLVKQPLKTFKRNAAPPFNLHIFDHDVSPLKELQGIMDGAVKAYPNESSIKSASDAVDKLLDLGDV